LASESSKKKTLC
jgi:hypothetical protein